MNSWRMIVILNVAIFWYDFTAGAKFFRAFKSCSDPSQNLCASKNSPFLMTPGIEFQVLYRELNLVDSSKGSCIGDRVLTLCSWICTGNASCVGFNFFYSGDYQDGGDFSQYCQLFSDFPKDYHYSNNCSFFTTSANESGCYTFPIKEWILIQQRMNDSTIFSQNWIAFKNGFGDRFANFWLGLQKVYELTRGISYSIRFEGVTQNGLFFVDEYSSFIINDEGSGYSIFASGYVGNNTNFMDFAVGGLITAKCNAAKFSTFDADNDLNILENCASTHSGGWWYHSKCDTTNFNGLYSKFFNVLTHSQTVQPLKSSRIFVKEN